MTIEKTSDAMICAVLRGDTVAWPQDASEEFEAKFVERAAFHRVHLLLGGIFGSAPWAVPWPARVRERLDQLSHADTITEMVRSREMVRVLDALAAEGVSSLLMKGTALAFTTYASPNLRPRGDTDFLIPKECRERAEKTLCRLGYTRGARISGKLIEYQAPYFRENIHGVSNILDLHWRVSNRQSLAAAFDFDALASRSVPVLDLGPNARALGPLDALLVACVHGPAHHDEKDRPLIWTYDVNLLAEALSGPEWEDLVRYAEEGGIRQLCLAALRESRERYGTCLPESAIRALSGAKGERSARLLDPRRRDFLWEDLASLDGWTDKIRFLREAAFPSPAYLRQRYSIESHWMLPALYMHRGISGIIRRVRAQ